MWRFKSTLVAVTLLFASVAVGSGDPRPPCGVKPFVPGFAAAGVTPTVQVWHFDTSWNPPACVGWAAGDGIVVALAAQFRFNGSADDLLTRVGAISSLQGLRYWSVTDRAWRTLVSHATALKGPDLTQPRPDFAVAELKAKQSVFFAQDDNRTSNEVIYRLDIREFTQNRVVVATANITPITTMLITLVKPEGFQSIHFLERQGPDIWTYYGLARSDENLPPVLAVPEASYVNRATAFCRHLIGAASK
jgi:hypothetical protein